MIDYRLDKRSNMHMQYRLRRKAAIIWIFVFCLFQLSGCSFFGKPFARRDGAPSADIDVSKIPDAVPKVEALSPYGNNDYAVYGHRYHVLRNAKGYDKRGYASWYGTKFHGQMTSTRERYNLYDMTAASPVLPLPSYVQVTNLRNGKKVVVKVNDRGPFSSNRILDLSYAAAKKLGYANHGTAYVRVVAIDPKTWDKAKPRAVQHPQMAKAAPIPTHQSIAASGPATQKDVHTVDSAAKTNVYLQVGAFSQLANAQQLSKKVMHYTQHPIHIAHISGIYKVQIGPLANSTQGDQLKQLLEENGFDHVVTVVG